MPKSEFFSQQVLRGVNDRIEAAMRQMVLLVENRVKTLQTTAHSGRWYRIGTTPTKGVRAIGRRGKALGGRWYQASAPGEPPAIKSSRLFKSVTSRVEATLGRGGGVGWLGMVGTNVADYPPALEFGVKAGEGKGEGTGRAMQTVAVRVGAGGRVKKTIGATHITTHAGGWRLAPRPLWGRAVKELSSQIKGLWDAAAARGRRAA